MSDVEKAREDVAGHMCEGWYWANPERNHHDVCTCGICYGMVDALIAAVRAEERERVLSVMRSECNEASYEAKSNPECTAEGVVTRWEAAIRREEEGA